MVKMVWRLPLGPPLRRSEIGPSPVVGVQVMVKLEPATSSSVLSGFEMGFWKAARAVEKRVATVTRVMVKRIFAVGSGVVGLRG